MSITQTRNFIEKSGCGWIVSIILGVVLFFGLFYASCFNGPQSNDANTADTTLATIGDQKVSALAVETALQEGMARLGNNPDAVTPAITFMFLQQALENEIGNAVMANIAKAQGVDVSDGKILAEATAQIQASKASVKESLISSKKLKANSTDTEFDKAFKEATQNDWATYVSEQVASVKQMLDDPARRSQVIAQFTRQAVIDKLAAGVQVTEDEVKSSYDTFTLKRVFIPTTDKDAVSKVNKAIQEVKAGATFESVMDKYSKDQPEPKKKVSELVSSVPRSSLTGNAQMEPLLKLKVGELSGVVQTEFGPAVYKLMGTKQSPPADWDKKKAEYILQYKKNVASKRLFDEIAKVRTSGTLKFSSAAYQAIDAYTALRTNTAIAGDPAKKLAALLKIAQDAKKAANDDLVGSRAAILLRFSVMNEIWQQAKPEERAKYLDDRIESINAVLDLTEDTTLRLDLVDLNIEKKDFPSAITCLVAAASSNNTPSAAGQDRYNKCVAALDKLKTLTKLSPEDEKRIQDELDRWAKEKAEEDKRLAEAKKAEEEQRKKDEAEAKKAKDVKPVERGKDGEAKTGTAATGGSGEFLGKGGESKPGEKK